MFRFLSLSVALFLVFGAAWVWFTGDMRPIQLSHWKSMITGETAGATTANVGGSVTTVAKRAAPTPAAAPAAKPAEMVKLAFSRLGSPSGRYVSAPAMTATATKTLVAVFKRIGSPLGRYVTAAAAAAPVPKGYKRISSPGGRYVNAPKVIVKRKPTKPKYTVVGSPGGRYVKAPKVIVKRKPSKPKYTVVGSPGGRYVKGPKTVVKRQPSKYTVVGSPGGRYVTGPKVKVKPKPKQSKYTVVGSPGGRYVTGPASAPEPRKSASGALVFPITFEYPSTEFTPNGRKAVDDLLTYIRTKKYTDITLSGHTDSRGKEKANLLLSEQRLKAVVEHLRNKGYKGGISIIPKGESEPNTSIDRTRYSQDQLYNFDRRVELVSGGR